MEDLQWVKLCIHGIHQLGEMSCLRPWEILFVRVWLSKAVGPSLNAQGNIVPKVEFAGKKKRGTSLRLWRSPSVSMNEKGLS